MEIEETINKWFEETNCLMQNRINNANSIDGLCECVLQGSKNYCNAILLLLDKGHEMPAKALLRVLYELFAKVAWCLRVPDDVTDDENILVKEKIRRWEKHTLLNNIKILEKFERAGHNKNIGRLMSTLKSEDLYLKANIKCMPDLFEITKQLPEPFTKKAYPFLYLQFNNSVHLDTTSLVKSFSQKSNKTAQDTLAELYEYCTNHAFYINSIIRLQYDDNTVQITKEYKEIVNTINQKNL